MTAWLSVDDTNFDTDVLATSHDRPVVVLIGATWCGHCQPLADDLAAVLDPLGDRVSRVKLWVDRPGLVQGTLDPSQRAKSTVHNSLERLGMVSGLPRTLVLRNGAVIEGFHGRPNDDAFLVRFSVWLQTVVMGRRSVLAMTSARGWMRRLPFYRGRMGLGIKLPPTSHLRGIPDSAP